MKKHIAATAVLSVFVAIGARAASEEDFVAGCLASLNWNKAMCECAAKKAKKELTPRGFDFQVASFRKDDAETARLRTQMDIKEAVATGTFMMHAGKACGGSK